MLSAFVILLLLHIGLFNDGAKGNCSSGIPEFENFHKLFLFLKELIPPLNSKINKGLAEWLTSLILYQSSFIQTQKTPFILQANIFLFDKS